ncbi:hypothetical protein ACM26V_03685 [Salipaludibacillus sp. HK11]
MFNINQKCSLSEKDIKDNDGVIVKMRNPSGREDLIRSTENE